VGNRVGSRAIAVQQHPQLRPFCRFFLSLVSAPSPSLVCGQKQKDIGARNNQDIKTLLLIGSSVFIWHQKKKKKSIHWDLSAGNHLDKGKEGLVDKTIIQSQEKDDCLAPIQIEMSGIII
jgi:hypothetical protein